MISIEAMKSSLFCDSILLLTRLHAVFSGLKNQVPADRLSILKDF